MKKPLLTMDEKYAMAEKRFGGGKPSKGSKPAPKAKIKPTGNPLKGEYGLKWTKKF